MVRKWGNVYLRAPKARSSSFCLSEIVLFVNLKVKRITSRASEYCRKDASALQSYKC